jgi:hypothetical protein
MTLMEKGNNDDDDDDNNNNNNNNNNKDDDDDNNNHNYYFHIASYTELLVIVIKLKTKKNIFKVTILGEFVKFRKATISFVMPVRPSFSPHGTTRLQLEEFSQNFIFGYFKKSVEKIQVSLKSEKNNGYFTWRPIMGTLHGDQ